MRISTIGKLNKFNFVSKPTTDKAFTLVELIVVIALIGIVLVLAVPTTKNVFIGGNLKKASRQLIGLERKLRVDAVRDQVDYVLCLDLYTASYWVVSSDMTPEKENEIKKGAEKISAGVQIMDIVLQENKKLSGGEVRIKFSKNNLCPPMVIHLAEGEGRMTIVVNPFLGITGIYEEYVNILWEKGLGSERIYL
ncbi:MAG: type II secretion system protein [Smithellaceae bacterium]|nr:type II secretion system protein [Syntrophaceae bacterium]MBP8608281.1 type II secretion system protein [Syntrophaceae bacterium]NMD04300.1 type II secretion system protein [Deltaproteobacteria bacterium]